MKLPEAEEHLLNATSQATDPCWTAWRCLTWLRASQSQYAEALKSAGWLARALAESEDSFETKETSAWLGRMIAFLALAKEESPEVAAKVDNYDTRIREILADGRLTAYQRGHERLAEPSDAGSQREGPHTEAGGMGEEQSSVAEKRRLLDEQRNELYERFERVRGDAKQQFEAITKELDELNAAFKSQVVLRDRYVKLSRCISAIVEQLTRLPFADQTLFVTVNELIRDIDQRSDEDSTGAKLQTMVGTFTQQARKIALLSTAIKPSSGSKKYAQPMDPVPLERNSEIERLNANMAGAFAKWNISTRSKIGGILDRAGYLLRVRQQLVAQHNLTTAAAEQQDKNLLEWEKRIAAEAKRLAQRKKEKKEKTAAAAAQTIGGSTLRNTFREWFPLDFDLEKTCLLESFRR